MRDSANDAFFTAESLENLSEALVREGNQNSLDAAERSDARVRQIRVRIAFVPHASPDACQYIATLFNSARQNFENGLDCPNLDSLTGDACGYLVFEDFGTRGLTGDVEEWRLERAEQNAFFSFFRAEGRSAKTGEKLGRWGIGKQVFPTASRLHAMFGLTVRNETPRRALMGSAVVRNHSVAAEDFQPDGWFGLRAGTDDPVSPVTDDMVIDTFAAIFGLERGNTPGLSIVVPAIDERVNVTDLRRGVVRSFFWPILQGELVVDLESPDGRWRIDAETLASHRTLLPAPEAAVIEFAGWASTAKPAEIVTLPSDPATKPDWRSIAEAILPEEKLGEIRSHLETRERVAVKVPVRVRPKYDGGAEAMSFFTVFVAPCRDVGFKPVFLRDGIVITDVRAPHLSGNRSLVVVEHPPLATLLGDSEGVNHTQWQKDSAKFHRRYIYGPETIKFVSRSVYEIMQRLHAAETRGDPTLLLDIFYLPADDGAIEPSPKPTEKKEGSVVGGVPPLPPPKPTLFNITSVKGGFTLKPGKALIKSFPVRVRVQVGYAVRRGNALKRWAPDDFILIRPPLRQERADGVTVSRADGNYLELDIRKPDFHFEVSGFDTKRDLVVRALQLKSQEDEADV